MIQPSWRDCQCLFEWDGAWRDIVVPDADPTDFHRLLAFLQERAYLLQLVRNREPVPWPATTEELLAPNRERFSSIAISVAGVQVFWHISFGPTEMEMDVDPREVLGEAQFLALISFMEQLAHCLSQHVFLDWEGAQRDDPLLTYDPITATWTMRKGPMS